MNPPLGSGSRPREEDDALPSPALVLDLGIFEENLAAATDLLRGSAKLLRPHVKTHRTPGLAVRQLGDLAPGVSCATVGEAEAMVEGGITDVLVANEVVDRHKLDRLAALARRARLGLAVDSVEGVEAASAAASREGVSLEVLVDVDIGLGRCGARAPEAARALALAVARAPGLRLGGIMGYEGRLRRSEPHRDQRIKEGYARLAEVKDLLEREGLPVETVSAGGTSTLLEARDDPVITEIQAGTYALMESDLDGLGLPFRPAVSISATVISRSPGRVVLDAGRKVIACDYGLPTPLAARARTISTHEEHTILQWEGPLPDLGSRVWLRPSHVRLTFNLHDQVWLARDGRIEGRLPVSGRGRSQ